MSVVDRRGVEPRTSGLQGETVHQHPARARERTAGIEPASSVWKTDVSNQLHQIRTAADAGLEPALSDRESEGLPIAQSAELKFITPVRDPRIELGVS